MHTATITGSPLLSLSLPEVSHAAWHTALHPIHSELWLMQDWSVPSAVYRPSIGTGSVPATHTLLSWQTFKEKLWLRVYTSCLSILHCYSKNLENQQAQSMLARAASFGRGLHIVIQAFHMHLDNLWWKQAFLDNSRYFYSRKFVCF